MGEKIKLAKDTVEEPKKLSYDELNQVASDLHVQYQKLMTEYRKVTEALSNRDFEYTTAYLQMLFKVVEHPEMYRETFVDHTTTEIETLLMAMSEARVSKDEA